MPIFWMIKLTIQRSIRSRVSIIVFILLLLFLFVLPLTVLNDGSIKGKVQINLMWTMGGALLLLSFFSLFNSIMNIRADISEKQIYTLEATPITRYQMIIGKLLAVFIMNFILVIFTGLVCYGFTYYDYSKLKAANEQAEKNLIKSPKDEASLLVKRDFHILTNEVLASRLKIEDYFDIQEMAEDALQMTKKAGPLKKSEEETRKELENYYGRLSFFTVPPNAASRPIIFNTVPKPNEETLFYTFSYYLYSTNKMEDRIKGIWKILAVYDQDRSDVIAVEAVEHAGSVRRSIRFSTDKLVDVKRLYFVFENYSQNNVYSGVNEKFYLLIPYSSFELNLVKALALILMKLTLISFTGACAASFLTFNVSVFICLSFVFFCYLSDIMLKFLRVTKSYTPSLANDATNYFVDIWNRLSFYIVNFFPDFSNISGKLLVEGEYIDTLVLGEEFIFNLVCRGCVFLIISIVIFHFAEMGKEIADD